jgi:hypothetical protein
MRDPPETTTVKAPLWAANFAESSAAYLASDTARSSSASKMSRFFLDAAAGAAPSVAIAAVEGGARAEERRRGRGPEVRHGDGGGHVLYAR